MLIISLFVCFLPAIFKIVKLANYLIFVFEKVFYRSRL